MSEEEFRPDPDALLSAIQREEKRGKGGKLKIFLGMAAGVGKTYSMLEEAQSRKQEGVDVVLGCINTHGRQETARLLEGLEIIPERWVKYKDTVFEELDLDALLKRKPQLAIVDELAHTNVPGSAHPKRWQDVMDLLDAGIDVYTTLNVQHIESRKDLVEKITDVNIRETVPDTVLEKAAQIEVIDLSPSELLKRMKEGKVYLGPQSEIAVKHFFQEDRLTALRELALRITAEKVDHDLHGMIASTNKAKTWHPRERLLVAIDTSTQGQDLIRVAKRLASALDAPWCALYVDTGVQLTEIEKGLLTKNLAMARDLGAEVITTSDVDRVEAFERVIDNKSISQIILGRSAPLSWWRKIVGKPTFQQLLATRNPEIGIYIGAVEEELPKRSAVARARSQLASPPQVYLKTLLFVLALTFLNHWIEPLIGYKTVGLIFLLGVLVLSLFTGRGPMLFGATLSAVTWALVFTPSSWSSILSEPEDLIFFLVFFISAAITGSLISRIREREDMLRLREENSQAIYEIVRIIATYPDSGEIFKAVTQRLGTLLKGECRIIPKEIDNGLIFDPSEEDEKEQAVANWVFIHNKAAGWSTETLAGVNNLYIPLHGFKETVGVMTYRPQNPANNLLPEQQNMLYTVGQQLSNYIERSFVHERSRRDDYFRQVEKIQKALFDSISHEFRNPLMEIEEAAGEMTHKRGGDLSKSIKQIEESSKNLRHTVDNILTMSRLQSGFFVLNKQMIALSELVEACVSNTKQALSTHILEVNVPPDLPKAPLDFSLLELALCNLLINASEYAPKGSKICITGKADKIYLILAVTDEGPGVPPEVIELLLNESDKEPQTQIGLGLGIVKSISELHGGRFEILNNTPTGSLFSLFLPIQGGEPYRKHHTATFIRW